MSEILKRDQNHVTVLAGVTDDIDQDIVMLRVDPISKRLKIIASISLNNLSNVNITDPTNGQILVYNSTTQTWENQDNSGGGSAILVNGVEVENPNFAASTDIDVEADGGGEISFSINPNVVNNPKLAPAPAYTVKSNLTNGSDNPEDNTLPSLVRDMNVGPSVTEITYKRVNATGLDMYRVLGQVGSSVLSTSSWLANRMTMSHFIEYGEKTVETLSFELTANTSITEAIIFIYESGSDGLPSKLVYQTPIISVTGTGVFRQAGISLTLSAGIYFAGVVTDGGGTIRIVNFSQPMGQSTSGGAALYKSLTYSHTFGAVPDELTTSSLVFSTATFPAISAGYSSITFQTQ